MNGDDWGCTWLAIGAIWSLDLVALGRLHRRWADPNVALAALRAGDECLQGIVRPSHRARVRASARACDVEKARMSMVSAGARIHRTDDVPTGARLPVEADWPPVVAVRGAIPAGPTVAVVGMRNCSETGRRFTRNLCGDLASAGVCVVSGLAYGIDAAAHEGATAAGGAHVVVLAGGFDRIYPRPHRPLAQRLVNGGGALVSHVPPYEPSPGWRFPVRNRLIAGLADVVVVVEAAARGGALSTARHARDLDRPILCVPGFPWSPHAIGTNALLADGVEVCRGPGDVLTALALARPELTICPPRGERRRAPELDTLDRDARDLLDMIEFAPVDLDELTTRAGRQPADILRLLDELELAGLVAFETPGSVTRVDVASVMMTGDAHDVEP